MESRRFVFIAALTAFTGTLVSGPLGLWIIAATHPQPAWRDVGTFARAYHGVQSVPYFAGFLLVGGMVGVIAGLHAISSVALKARSACGLAFAGAFAAMIFINYAVQTTVVPSLVTSWQSGDTSAGLVATFTMVNSRSLGWALEMWGYAVLGVATWMVAPVLIHETAGALERAAARLFVLNGPLSILSAVATALLPGWVHGVAGLASFAAWNIIVLAMTLLVAIATRPQRKSSSARRSMESHRVTAI